MPRTRTLVVWASVCAFESTEGFFVGRRYGREQYPLHSFVDDVGGGGYELVGDNDDVMSQLSQRNDLLAGHYGRGRQQYQDYAQGLIDEYAPAEIMGLNSDVDLNQGVGVRPVVSNDMIDDINSMGLDSQFMGKRDGRQPQTMSEVNNVDGESSPHRRDNTVVSSGISAINLRDEETMGVKMGLNNKPDASVAGTGFGAYPPVLHALNDIDSQSLPAPPLGGVVDGFKAIGNAWLSGVRTIRETLDNFFERLDHKLAEAPAGMVMDFDTPMM
eukprot:GHVN01054937.1.p1 GENE.GHVN01054937.1~~GHVN01054937.1.p1  ORF type:complete len:272 (-),score=77.32 GHVN01054937.1:154-969(-)